MTGSDPGAGEYASDNLVHRLPKARVVNRAAWLVERARGRRIIHIGFADSGFNDQHQRDGKWLHAHLADVAAELVGIDIDADGVAAAVSAGYEAYAVDCAEPGAVAGLGLEPADVVMAGEVIEHIDRPGPFLDSLRGLCRPGGQLIVTTPNAYGLINVATSLLRIELNHPDHVMMFTWRTLTELARRHGWRVVETATYVPLLSDRRNQSGMAVLAMQVVLGMERALGRLGRPYAADGLIVVVEPT